MELEKVFREYDYVHATEETADALDKILYHNRGVFEDAGNLQNLQRCMAVLQEKICVKGFPVQRSPGYDMASRSVDIMKYVMNDCVDNGRVTKEDCQKMLFDFLLACIRTGPGSALANIIRDVLDIQHMKAYLEALKGKELAKLTSALKECTHTSEEPKMSLSDQCTSWENCTCIVLHFTSEGKDIQKADFQEQILDLYMFYFLKMNDVDIPVEYARPLQHIMKNIESFYRENCERNPYKNLKNKDLIRKHMVNFQDVIGTDEFGRSEQQVEQAKDIVKLLLHSIRENLKDLEDIWDSFLDFMKTLSFSKKCAEFPGIMEPFGWCLFGKMPKDSLKEHPELVDKWAPVFAEILLKAPSVKALELWAYKMADTVRDRCVLKKESAVAWFPVVKGLLRCGQNESAKEACRILREGKFKKIWTWKKNFQEATEMIEIIGKLDFLTSGTDYDSRLLCSYGECIKSLLEQLKLAKVADKAMGIVAVFVVSMMEKGSKALNKFTKCFADSVSLKNNLEIIPDLIKRFSTLYKDEDYPWDDINTRCCGQAVFKSVISAYSSGSDMPDDVNETLIKLFLYTMETEDLEYTDVVHGRITLYGLAASGYLVMFATKHLGSDNSDRALVPLMPAIIKQMDHEEKDLQEAARNVITVACTQAPAVISPHFNSLIKWYKTTHSVGALYAIMTPYQVGDGISKQDFDELMKAMEGDPNATSGPLQSIVINDMCEKQPEMFTQEHVDMLLRPKMLENTHSQYRLLLGLSAVIPKKPQLFGKNVVDRVLKNPSMDLTYSAAIKTIGVCLALHHKELAETVLAEFVNLSKKCDNPTYKVGIVDGIHTLGTQHGLERLDPYRPYIEDLQKNGATAALKAMATATLHSMDGISVEGIVKDVKQQKGDINVLNVKVTETTAKVNVVDKKVDKQGKEIITVHTGLKTANTRVDVVEKDLDETKIKVEEVDNKTMTNAPKWSRDLTKLMNPKTEHDWRLLAQRLAYTPEDIKGWATQHDPCMGLLSEWYATHKTIEATHAVLTALQEMNRMDAAAIVENAMKAVEGVVEEEVDYVTPPPIFLSYQWGHQNEVKLLRNHLQMAGYECWMDIGQMGGGDKLFEKIDNGIRGAKIIICCVSEKYSKSPNCNREVNLSTSLGKPMIPLLMEKMAWPPKGSMGPIFSEYLFVRFFQRGGEETEDQRYWPVPKFQELLMQLNMYKAMPDESLITKEYKDWWTPMAEEIVITKKTGGDGGQSSSGKVESTQEEEESPDVFLSYQWGKQPQIKQLYRRLNELGYSCWMDIYQMGGGDSLYDKIDKGVRGCKVVLNCITTKYSLSANCRREVSLADSLKKPMVPLLLEKIDWPPAGPMSMVFTQLLFINFYRDEKVQMSWDGSKFDELHGKIKEYLPSMSTAGHLPAVKGSDKSAAKSDNVGLKTENKDVPPTTTPKSPKDKGPKVNSAGVMTIEEKTKQNAPKEETKSVNQAKEQPARKEETKLVDKPKKKSSACVLL